MRKKLSVGVMIGNINAEFSYEMAYGISKFFAENNIDSTVLMSGTMSNTIKQLDSDDIYFSSVYEYYKALEIDALIITYASIIDLQSRNYNQKFLSKFEDIPYVLLQDSFKSNHSSNVVVNNKLGFENLIKHLVIDHEYKNFVYVSGPKENYDAHERLDVFIDQMKKYHININDSKIGYGDFSANIEDIVNKLLDDNPDTEVMVFANDTMAIASYDVLNKRGLTVGKDIAVTGFDDMAPASIVQPLLSTVSQDPVGLGYEAGKAVLELLVTKRPSTVVLNTEFIKRNSCGCSDTDKKEIKNTDNLESRIYDLVEGLYEKSKISFDVDFISSKVYEITKDLINTSNVDDLVENIKDYVIMYVNKSILYRNVIVDLVDGIFEICLSINSEKKELYTDAMMKIQKWMFHYITREIEKSTLASQEKFSQSSYLLRNAFNMELSREEIFLKTFEQFKGLGVKSSYVYLNNGIKKCINKEAWVCPDKMSLVAYFDDKETIYLDKKKRINYNINDKKISSNKGKNTLVFSLYSKSSQYGFIVVEAPFNETDVIQMLCTQLNTLLYFNEIQRNETRIRKELEESITEIETKNEILNNISMYDELTQIYNRRGLLENAIEFINKQNSKVQVLFCDLDHLKEINDNFGHKEGDFAIRHIAEELKKNLPKDSIIGRIGGDEFVAIYSLKGKNSTFNISKIKDSLNKYNSKSDKEYYIETSIGNVDYTNYNGKVDLTELINEADKVLYEEKKKRRSSILK